MKNTQTFLIFATVLFSIIVASAQEIPIEHLQMNLQPNKLIYSKALLKNEIAGIKVEHITLTGDNNMEEKLEKGSKFIYLFIKGEGTVVADLETAYKRDERVIRYLTTKLDKHAVDYAVTRRSKVKSAKA